jgi:hypothetical protein
VVHQAQCNCFTTRSSLLVACCLPVGQLVDATLCEQVPPVQELTGCMTHGTRPAIGPSHVRIMHAPAAAPSLALPYYHQCRQRLRHNNLSTGSAVVTVAAAVTPMLLLSHGVLSVILLVYMLP